MDPLLRGVKEDETNKWESLRRHTLYAGIRFCVRSMEQPIVLFVFVFYFLTSKAHLPTEITECDVRHECLPPRKNLSMICIIALVQWTNNCRTEINILDNLPSVRVFTIRTLLRT